MKINVIKVGLLQCNCYILEIDWAILIIDPGDESEKILPFLKNKKVLGIIITHHHFDHIGAVNKILDKYQVQVYDKNNLSEGKHSIGKFSFEVIYTPGHKEDLITIYFKKDKVMFCGDFIFKNGIGRCDLDGGNWQDMLKSIQKIKKYDKNIIIYPGHGDKVELSKALDFID